MLPLIEAVYAKLGLSVLNFKAWIEPFAPVCSRKWHVKILQQLFSCEIISDDMHVEFYDFFVKFIMKFTVIHTHWSAYSDII